MDRASTYLNKKVDENGVFHDDEVERLRISVWKNRGLHLFERPQEINAD